MSVQKESVDTELLHLLEHGVKHNHRVIIGVHGRVRDVVHHIHSLLSRHRTRPQVVWMYEKQLEVKPHKIERAKKRKGAGVDTLSAFESFVSNTEITYVFHSECEKVLGTTVDLCVLQDFSKIKANTLASVVESVRGGGIVLLPVEETESVFTKRLYRLLSTAENYAVVDTRMKLVQRPSMSTACTDPASVLLSTALASEVEKIKADTNQLNPLSVVSGNTTAVLLQKCKTHDQIGAVVKMGASLDKRSTLAVTADRGRGKSAALGLAVSLALTKGMNDVLIVSPHLSNVQTLFEFIVLGLSSNGYKEQIDYHIGYSHTNKKLVEKVTVTRTHYQSVRFLSPQPLQYSPSLLVVDEAAAVPLPILSEMMGMYPVLLSSTTAGYEGTGRALSLKFFKTLKPEMVHLEEPIRYGKNDPVEKWLNASLALSPEIPSMATFPPPGKCRVYALNKELLFSGAAETEKVLGSLSSILLSGHYKNSPNDLQILADNPAHALLALLTEEGRVLGLCQTVQEGGSAPPEQKYKEGRTEEGNLIPWALSQYFTEMNLFGLSGVRVVRIAIHPDAQSMGYGTYLVGQIEQAMQAGEGARARAQTPSLFVSPFFPRTDYLGVSFGVTPRLLEFWQKQGMAPLYLKHSLCKSTREHSLIMGKALNAKTEEVLAAYNKEFSKRFVALLPGVFREMPCVVAAQLITPVHDTPEHTLSQGDTNRLKQYAYSNLELRVVLDLLPALATSVVQSRKKPVSSLSVLLLLSLGLQHKTLEKASSELGVASSQARLLLAKATAQLAE
ncbi:N-acetyltransferase 10 [Nematocida sp. AWRm77]|nr:N-acetyltransferase 10 [Nematocida sp. AWRm77]